MVARNTTSLERTETWWPAAHLLQSGQCHGGRQLILYRQDSDLEASNSSSSVMKVPVA
jgi:hypothetical protein